MGGENSFILQEDLRIKVIGRTINFKDMESYLMNVLGIRKSLTIETLIKFRREVRKDIGSIMKGI